MKSTVSEKPCKEDAIKYPYLAAYTGGAGVGGVILLTSAESGTVVDAGKDGLFNHLGFHSDTWRWRKGDIKPLKGSVCLEN